jgi:hydroxymethylpyrimidine pyrophosphatase-like HAD family hydrolase
MLNIAFDVDGTLLDTDGTPRKLVLDMLFALLEAKNVHVYVWSGGGIAYAEQRGRDLMLPSAVKYVSKMTKIHMDITFDDLLTNMGDKNVHV